MDYFAHETAVIDKGAAIGADTQIWHFAHIMAAASIGRSCTIGQNVMVADGVVLGDRVKVQNNVSLYTGVRCEDDVFIGPSVVFTNVINPRSAIVRKDKFLETLVKKGATIGANATIICGNEIGQFAFIGAGAVLTRPAKPYALLIGNPARQSGWISEFGHRLVFGADNRALCPEGNQEYALNDNQVTKITG